MIPVFAIQRQDENLLDETIELHHSLLFVFELQFVSVGSQLDRLFFQVQRFSEMGFALLRGSESFYISDTVK